MSGDEMARAWRADMDKDRELRAAEDALRGVGAQFDGRRDAGSIVEALRLICEERARIVRRWD